MKSLFLQGLLLSSAWAAVVPKGEEKVDYTGYKLLRLALPEGSQDLQDQIEEIAAHVLNPGKTANLDVVVSPESVDAITALVDNSVVINEDVGAALAEEGELVSSDAGLKSRAGPLRIQF